MFYYFLFFTYKKHTGINLQYLEVTLADCARTLWSFAFASSVLRRQRSSRAGAFLTWLRRHIPESNDSNERFLTAQVRFKGLSLT